MELIDIWNGEIHTNSPGGLSIFSLVSCFEELFLEADAVLLVKWRIQASSRQPFSEITWIKRCWSADVISSDSQAIATKSSWRRMRSRSKKAFVVFNFVCNFIGFIKFFRDFINNVLITFNKMQKCYLNISKFTAKYSN